MESAADRLETLAFDCFIQEQTEEFSVSCLHQEHYVNSGMIVGGVLQVTVVTVKFRVRSPRDLRCKRSLKNRVPGLPISKDHIIL